MTNKTEMCFYKTHEEKADPCKGMTMAAIADSTPCRVKPETAGTDTENHCQSRFYTKQTLLSGKKQKTKTLEVKRKT